MKRLWVAFFVFPAMALAEIETLQVKQYCSFDSRLLPSASVRTFGSDQAAQQAVQRIMRHAGVRSFILKAASIPNAMAVIQNRKRYILYNQSFMRQVNNAARTDWAGLSILAHEIGHHLHGHTLGGGHERQVEELQADHYSGFILQQMGASLEEATLAMKTVPGLEASTTHPARQERVDAIVNGWIEAEEVKGKSFKREQPGTINLANNLQLIRIPAGSFQMGSNQGTDDEKPVHTVTIPRPFWMSRTETTFAQYDAYATASGKPKPSDSGWGRGSRPVINVSWYHAQGYAKWLSANNTQNLQCRLPSEAEWEYAARAGTTTKYPWGNTASHQYANYGKDQCCGGLASGQDRWVNTSPAGSFPANRFGLQDMHGNVLEWVQDDWHDNYQGAPTNGAAWNSGGRLRVLRGGSWFNTPYFLRSANRFRLNPDYRYSSFGFRVVCSPPSVR